MEDKRICRSDVEKQWECPGTCAAHRIEVPENIAEFRATREAAITQSARELLERLHRSYEVTDEEINAGVFSEMIEPQCREAIFTMRRKGYNTLDSGFGYRVNTQLTNIATQPSPETISLLREEGFFVCRNVENFYQIGFCTPSPDLGAITAQWDHLASLLPDRGVYAEPSPLISAVEFRKVFTPTLK